MPMAVSARSPRSGRNSADERRNAARPPSTVSWHTIFCFNALANAFLRTIPKGSHVYVEANYELRDADPEAEAGSPSAQRQIFLRHGAYLRCFSDASTAQPSISKKTSAFSSILSNNPRKRKINPSIYCQFMIPVHELTEAGCYWYS